MVKLYEISLKEKVARMYLSGMSPKKIRESVGISKGTYYFFLGRDKSFKEILENLKTTKEKKDGDTIPTENPLPCEKKTPVSDIIEKARGVLDRALDSGDVKIALEIYKIYRPRECSLPKEAKENIPNTKEDGIITELAAFAKAQGGGDVELKLVSNG